VTHFLTIKYVCLLIRHCTLSKSYWACGRFHCSPWSYALNLWQGHNVRQPMMHLIWEILIGDSVVLDVHHLRFWCQMVQLTLYDRAQKILNKLGATIPVHSSFQLYVYIQVLPCTTGLGHLPGILYVLPCTTYLKFLRIIIHPSSRSIGDQQSMVPCKCGAAKQMSILQAKKYLF